MLGNKVLVLGCLAMYLVLVVVSCGNDFTLPVLLFFLPWSSLLRISPVSFSCFTFGMLSVCLVSVYKRRFFLRQYPLKAGFLLVFLTLLSKLLEESRLSADYIAFLMMLFLFPVVKEEWASEQYDFFQVVAFFSLGIILAALSALAFSDSPNLSGFITVDAYWSIVRRSGYIGDANFYAAQILAAMGGALALTLQETKKPRLAFLGAVIPLLIYCGFLSGSKSFVLVAGCLVLLWMMGLLKTKGKMGRKLMGMIALALAAGVIATSALFRSLIKVLWIRFSNTRDLESFTTGRIGLWVRYFEEIMGNPKVFFLGKGFTNLKVDGRGSHNTIIQMVYQFGLFGVLPLLYWIVCFFSAEKKSAFDWKTTLVFVGTVVPWLAIDILFFDEFFLFQWYLLSALRQPQSGKGQKQPNGGKRWTGSRDTTQILRR